MQYEGASVYFLAEIRHAELQAEIEQYRSGRLPAGLIPGFSALTLAGWQRVVAAANASGTMIGKVARFASRVVAAPPVVNLPARVAGWQSPADPLA